jgi:Domain of unknown function (DUF1929)
MPKNKAYRRGRPHIMLITTLMALLMTSLPMSLPAFAGWRDETRRNSMDFKQQYGYWQTIDLPEEFKLNAIHAALLPTGKVLLVAGTGNNREAFNSYYDEGKIAVIKTVVLDPVSMQIKLVETPRDLFCGGHAFLHSGKLLVAGGTVGYEVLAQDVRKPAGPMVIHNEDPDSPVKTFPKGTRFIGPNAKVYLSTEEVVVEPAHKADYGEGRVDIHHSSTKVFVEAEGVDDGYITSAYEQYKIEDLSGTDAHNIYGQGGPMTRNKQDFRGDNRAFEFDPVTEQYVEVDSMGESRWYPSLPVLTNGEVLAVSGLDNVGVITETTEFYNPEQKKWRWGPNRAFPSYPALFRTSNPDVLFFSGSSAGYGPQDKGREPGLWNVRDNSFTPVKGLRETAILETSASVMLPPKQGSNDGSQSQRVMLAGGGGIGESELVTARSDIIDLSQPNPAFQPGPYLPAAVRYLNMTVMPWDEVIGTGGTNDYRAKSNSYSHETFSYNPASNTISNLATTPIGRGYHSGTLLLPDGRVLVFGGDPLYGDKDNTKSGKFEQRLEIFTPPQLFVSERPVLEGLSAQEINRGDKLKFTTSSTAIKTARLIPPSSTTHVTNIEQRSVAAIVNQREGELTIDIPSDENVLPNGWYMLFVTNEYGTPSIAKMVQIVR